MAETAAHLAENVIPRQPIQQWVISFPIPLRILLASQPQLLSPVLKVIHRAISGFLIKQAGFRADEAHTGVVTLIQRFGSVVNLNIHLHCLFLDDVYRLINGKAVFHPVSPPNTEQIQTVLQRVIQRLMRCLVRRGVLVVDQGQLYLDESESTDPSMASLQASSSKRAHQDPPKWRCGAQTEKLVKGWHHPYCNDAPGIPAETGGTGASPPA